MLNVISKLLGLDEDFFGPPKKTTSTAAATNEVPAKKAFVDEGAIVTRVDMVQRMWGDGFSMPGSPEYVVSLAKPLSLDPQKSVLDMSAGLGGMARTLANSFKTYITALERDEEIAREGMRISAKTGFSKHAPITHYAPERFDYNKRVDAVIARELLYTLPNKEETIGKIADVIKPRGHLLITDFTSEDPEAALGLQPTSLWRESEPYGVHLDTAKNIGALLDKFGFDVRINEDMTKAYAKQVLFGFSRVTKSLGNKKLAPSTKAVLKKEVDRWSRCLGALETGIKNTRFYAIKVR